MKNMGEIVSLARSYLSGYTSTFNKVCPYKIWSVHTYHNYINPTHSCGIMVMKLLCQQTLGVALNTAHCRTAQPAHLCNLLLGNLADAGSINFEFNTSHSAHDIVSKLSKMTALQRFSPEVSNHLLGRAPMEAVFLHVHPISNEKLPDVDMPLLLKALPFCSRRMELLLSCNSRFSIIPHPCDNRK